MSNERLRQLCIEWDWFTLGSNMQYEKLFILNSNGESIEILAAIIWVCSENCSKASIEEILRIELRESVE